MDNPGKSALLVIGSVGQLPFLVQYSSIFFGRNSQVTGTEAETPVLTRFKDCLAVMFSWGAIQ